MYNITNRKWISELEKEVEILKKDYKTFEKKETEEARQEVLKDIKIIRTDVGVINQKIKDIRVW